MKKLKTILSALVMGVIAISLTGCQNEEETTYAYGKGISFNCVSESHGTRAAYSGLESGQINWSAGDMIRIYCEQASKPADKWSDYDITDINTSEAKIKHNVPKDSLCWGAKEPHHFYAVYPSPKLTNSCVTDFEGKTITAKVKKEQHGDGGFNDGIVMVDNTTVADPTTFDKTGVFLTFRPITTAIAFSIKNGLTSDVTITKVELISEHHALNGTFTYDIETNTACDKDGSVTNDEKEVFINTNTLLKASEGDPAYEFTFILRPDENLDDLYIVLTDKNGVTYTSELKTSGGAYTFKKGIKTVIGGVVLEKKLTLMSISPGSGFEFGIRGDGNVEEEILF